MSDLITYDPFHGDPGNAIVPHRPSLAQLGGGAYQDDQSDPPDLDTMPSAEMENVNEKTLAGIARTADIAVFSIKFSAGAPYLDKFACADATLVSGDFTITDAAAGVTEITWAADTFPVPAADPCGLTMNDAGAAVVYQFAEAIANGIRVTTADVGGLSTDCDFTVCLK